MRANTHNRHLSGRGGFTLVEMMIVVAILGILTAIAVPAYINYVSGAKKAEAKTNLQSLRLLIEQYYSENAKYCPVASCSGQSYAYTEDDSGTITSNTIGNSYLTSFKPKAASGAGVVLYNYAISLSSNTAYNITASPVTSRGAPSGNLTINQDGAKTGW